MKLSLAVLAAAASAATLCPNATSKAPDTFTVTFQTTAGTLRLNITRALSPIAVDRFHDLVLAGYYNDNGFVRIERGSLGFNFVQWGIASSPNMSASFACNIMDEPVRASNLRGTVAFAADQLNPNTRSSMIYVNMQDNAYLDSAGFAPFAVVDSNDGESWETLYNLSMKYMEGIYLPEVFAMGSEWLRAVYPGLTYTTQAVVGSSPRAGLSGLANQEHRAVGAHAGKPKSTLQYTVSWLGNTYGGGPDQTNARNASWVSYNVEDLFVTSEGVTITDTPWDEGTREAAIIAANGTLTGLCTDLHGWSRLGGYAVTASATAIYVGMSQAPLSYVGPLRDYPSVDTWTAIRVYNTHGEPVPIPGGRGWDSSMLVVCSNCSQVTGLAVSPDGTLLYASLPDSLSVAVYDVTANYSLKAQWKMPGQPGKLAVEPSTGRLWVAAYVNVTGLVWPYPSSLPPTSPVWHVDTTSGIVLSLLVSDVGIPSDIAVHGPSNTLLVADNAVSQQIVAYAIPATDPAGAPASVPLVRTAVVGALGGVLAGAAPGRVRPDAFSYIMGLGVADTGDIVVASDGYTTNKIGSGLDIRRLTLQPSLGQMAHAHRQVMNEQTGNGSTAWTAAQLSVSMVWNLLGLEWVDGATILPQDPSSPSMPGADVILTEHERFVWNYSAPVGLQWSYVGYTVDALAYSSSDARLNTDNFFTASPVVRSLTASAGAYQDVSNHMWLRGMYVHGVAWYRFESQYGVPSMHNSSEAAVPCGLIQGQAPTDPTAWPVLAPRGVPFAWQDSNGDGLMQNDEFMAFPAHYWDGVWSADIDGQGGLWLASENNFLLYYASTVNPTTGCVTYNFSQPLVNVTQNLPPFVTMERALYSSTLDALIVTGFTQLEPNPARMWGQAGRWAARYDSFLGTLTGTGAPPPAALGWDIPWDNNTCTGVCAVDDSKAAAWIDDILAVVTSSTATVHLFNSTTGATLGTMDVAAGGAAMGNYTGWVDTPYGLTISRAAGGSLDPPGSSQRTYTVLVEEDGREKIVVYTVTFGA